MKEEDQFNTDQIIPPPGTTEISSTLIQLARLLFKPRSQEGIHRVGPVTATRPIRSRKMADVQIKTIWTHKPQTPVSLLVPTTLMRSPICQIPLSLSGAKAVKASDLPMWWPK